MSKEEKMVVYEKTAKVARVFESTLQLIDKWRDGNTIGCFIDDAVKFYIRHSLDNTDDVVRIRQSLDTIKQVQETSLGLLCEVLRQEGILNGNGEILARKEG